MNAHDLFSLSGKVAVVTGGAGLFGRQIVEAVAEAGATVFMASRNLSRLNEEAATLRAAGLDVSSLQYDQSNESSIQELLDQVVHQAGRVHILINNAVLRTMEDWACERDAEKFALSMDVNATGLYSILRRFGEHMAGHGDGSIINIGSIQGMVGPDLSLYEGLDLGSPPDYFFHKGGMLNLTRYAAAKLGPRGVRVNTISPGGFFNDQDPRFVSGYNQRTFLGRMANNTDLKGPVVFLASDASAYVTGTNLVVDGGYTAK